MAESLRIAIAGNKGGVGKTLVAVNLFYAIKDFSEQSCTLVDAHIQVPNIYHFIKGLPQAEEHVVRVRIPEIDQNACTFCGRCVHYCAYDSILMIKDSGHIKVLDDYCTSCGACVYACNDNAISERVEELGKVSTYTLDRGEFVEGRMFAIRPLVSPVINHLNEIIEDKPLVIIDTPPGNSYAFAESIRNADFTILITEPGKAGLANLYDQIKLLKDLNQPFGVLINKVMYDNKELQERLGKMEIPVLMEIPFKPEYSEMHMKSEVIVQHNSALRLKFQEMYHKIAALRKEVRG